MGWIATVVKGVIGGIQMGSAIEELKHLPGSREYSLNQDLATATALARRGAQQGMTPEERAVAGQAIGTQQSRTQRAMEQRGLGSLAAAITQSNATEAFNRLEAQNQQIKRDYLGTYGQLGSKVQALENANVTSFNQQLAMQQRELGMAAQQGFASLAGTGAQLANAFDKEQIDKWKSQYDQRQAQKAQTELASIDPALGAPKTTMGEDSEFMQTIGTEDFKPMTAQEAIDASKPGVKGFGSTGLDQGIDPGTGFSTDSIGGIGGNLNMAEMNMQFGEIGNMNMDVGTTDYNMDFGSVGGTAE